LGSILLVFLTQRELAGDLLKSKILSSVTKVREQVLCSPSSYGAIHKLWTGEHGMLLVLKMHS